MMIMNLPLSFSPTEMLLDYDVYTTTCSGAKYNSNIGGWVGIIYDCKSGATVWCSSVFRSPGAASLSTDEKLRQLETDQTHHFTSIQF